MKKLLFLSFFSLVMITSCSDPCDDVDCGSNGVCVDGTCDCNTGYEGTFCDTETRAKYLGTYSGDITPCLEAFGDLGMIPGGGATIPLTVTQDPDNVENVLINISNPLLMIDNISTNPTGTGFIIPPASTTIDVEDIPLPITITVTGDGEFQDENTLLVNISLIIPLFPSIDCTITLTK